MEVLNIQPVQFPSHTTPIHGSESIASSLDSNESTFIHAYNAYTMDQHISTLQALIDGDCKDEKAILALPRRRNKSQRPLAFQLAAKTFPDKSEKAAIIQYEQLTTPAKASVRQLQRDRIQASLYPKDNGGGKLLKIQGPWPGQEADPVDLKGPKAIPMPVTIGSTADFSPVFTFLTQNKAFDDAIVPEDGESLAGKYGVELPWKSPMLEFDRGIVYKDGRLDLCKKVVGPTHIGNLMESLESNHQIKHFLLGNNAISTTGAKRIADFLQKHPDRMETWYLAGCHITRHGLSILVPQMITSSTINNVWFKRNPFGPHSSSLLAELVLNTRNLRTLDLETTELGDEGSCKFIDLICGHPSSLRHLYLNANGIGQKACASLGRYLADPNCALESLFLATNPIGDAGMLLLAPGLAKNKTLKRFTATSAGLTSKGVISLATAFSETDHPLHTLDLSASQTTKAHGQKFNYLDDSCIEALKSLISSPNMRSLELGRTVFSEKGFQDVRSTVGHSELVHFVMHRVEISGVNTTNTTSTELYETVAAPKSCSLAVRNQLVKNQAKYYPHIKEYDDFLNSEELRFLRNTSDVRQIDSMYRTRDKRLGLPMDSMWEPNDPTWKLIVEDAEKWQREA